MNSGRNPDGVLGSNKVSPADHTQITTLANDNHDLSKDALAKSG